MFHARAGDVVAVDGVDLQVKAGEVFGFLGPNRAGKSTTIRMLVTLLAPTAGWARVAGFDIGRDPEQVRRRIGYVAQGGATLAVESSRDEIAGDVVAVGVGAQAERAFQVLRAQRFVRSAAINDSTIRMRVEEGAVATVAIVRLLDAFGLTPTSLALTCPSLDDVFLAQTGRSLCGDKASPATAAKAS